MMNEGVIKKSVITDYNSLNLTKFWVPVTNNFYQEALDTFFPNGAKFNGDIPLHRTIYKNHETLLHTNLGIKPSLLNIPVTVKIKLHPDSDNQFSVSLVLGENAVYYCKFTISQSSKTIIGVFDGAFINVTNYTYDFDTYELYITFIMTDPTNYYNFLLTGFVPRDFIELTEYINRNFGLLYVCPNHVDIPKLDSIDFCMFLWALKKGIVLPNLKIASGPSLINNKFLEIDIVETMMYNPQVLSLDKFSEIIKTTRNGDIYVFNQGDMYHGLYIVDIDKRLYTEVSPKVENELGVFYNAKINPYDFQKRCQFLSMNAIWYRVRLN